MVNFDASKPFWWDNKHRLSQVRLARNQSDMLHLMSLIEDHKLFPKPPWPMPGQPSCHHDPHQSNFPKRWKRKWTTTKNSVCHAERKCILYTVLVDIFMLKESTQFLSQSGKGNQITFNFFLPFWCFKKIMKVEDPPNIKKKTRSKQKGQ